MCPTLFYPFTLEAVRMTPSGERRGISLSDRINDGCDTGRDTHQVLPKGRLEEGWIVY